MTLKLKIPGMCGDIGTKESELAKESISLPLAIRVQEVVEVASAREAGGAVMVELAPPPSGGEKRQAGQVCEVELEGGITLWLRPASLYRDFGARSARGMAHGEKSDVWEIAPSLDLRGAARGGPAELRMRKVTVYRVERAVGKAAATVARAKSGRSKARGEVVESALGVGLDIAAGKVADLFAGSVGRAVERHQLRNEPGLYLLDLGDTLAMQRVASIEAEGPTLLFLHGTMSSFGGSFGALWDAKNIAGAEARRQLARRYGHAYAWEHHTLTESPIENALALADKLPDGAKLHLVSHSRGGLVGDLLCLGQRVKGEEPLSPNRIQKIFELAAGPGKSGARDKALKSQAGQLQRLIETLERQEVNVERFVRVACPALGTTLASGKLDRWLSVVKLLNDLVLPFSFPLQLLIALIAEHDDPSQLPGLEAMTPGSPLVRLLNFPELQVTADLSVISGDTEGKGLFGRLKELMLDRFFEDECDVVVNTGAMFGGLQRVDGGRFYLDSGPEVNHFSYFKNDETVRMLAAGLLRSDGTDAGFRPLSVAPEKEPARAVLRRAPQGPLPVVFVLPGIMGSSLEIDGKRIWLNKLALMLGKFDKLEIDRDATPKELFEEYYGELTERLRETHEVVPFPYDWRRSILRAGEALAKQVNIKLDEIEQRGARQPVRILAHSMGGLVARAMIAQKPEVWRRMTAHDGARLVMLGTPNGGSYEIVRLLTGYASTLQHLALLDFTRNWAELLQVIVRFPGVLELLPTDNGFQYFGPGIWQELKETDDEMRRYKVELPDAADLLQARRTWETILAAPLDPARILYVAGQARETPIAWRPRTLEFPESIEGERHEIIFEATARGDGKVPWDTGIPPNVRTWYLPEVEHGDLPTHEEAFAAYLELLQNGTTVRLDTTPPDGVRAAALEQRSDLPRDVPPTLPDEQQLARSVLGSGVGRRKKKSKVHLPKARVSITHGNLGYALYPVCVGHYAGDTIVSAEDYLDKALDGRLRQRHRLGLYPGKLGTCEVLLNTDRYGKPAGAIVIGLGRVGELSPGSLEVGTTQAVLRYAIDVAECLDGRFGAAAGVPRSARITSLLIGTGAGGMTVRDSIEAILRGVAAANRLLCEQGLSQRVYIDAVEFMELWQDVAIQAAIELGRALLDGPLADLFVWPEHSVKTGQGGRRRVQFEEPPNWWHRMEILHDKKKDELHFIALTDRARAEESLVTGQLRLAEDLIRQTIADTCRDAKVTHALFEMLIPNRLKELAPHQYDLVLVVDEVSGSYPWELLEDRWNSGGRPPAVSAGMLRQLKTGEYRERPVTTLEDTAYVVGDPVVTGEAARMFPSLDGARKEAMVVADFLRQNGFTVTRQIRAESRTILAGIHGNGYRVLHLAGHGVHEVDLPVSNTPSVCEACEQPRPPQTKKISGMVIGDNVYLTPGDVEQMRWVPELVFINCCHLGSLGQGVVSDRPRFFNRLAANLAAQFIRMGVKAVVAAGWAVDDAAAETFATSFYRHLLASDKFGDAVRAAREETFDRHGSTNTWGAYQCYGDPDFRLRPREQQKKRNEERSYVSSAQAVMDLENLTNRARGGGDCESEVEAVVQAIKKRNEDWLKHPDVASALGLAYGELGLFRQAIEHLNSAIDKEKADYPMCIVEQRANFKSRWAVELKWGGMEKTGAPRPEELIEEATADLSRLLEFSKTAERLSLIGSAHKRRAWITQGDERKKALAKMAEHYREAHEKRYDEQRRTMDTYPLLNWLAAEILLGWYGEKPGITSAGIKEWCERARAFAEGKDRQDPSFWNSVVKPECDLVQALACAALNEQKQAIVNAYRHAKSRGASPREFRSVIEHVEFLTRMAAEAPKKAKLETEFKALQELTDKLAASGGQ
jgi:pimeloyl-ACP methyl ester carboxylesterase